MLFSLTSLLRFTSIRLNFFFFLILIFYYYYYMYYYLFFIFFYFIFYFSGGWQFLKEFLSPSRITDAQGCRPLSLSPYVFSFVFVFLVVYFCGFPGASRLFFFPLCTFPTSCLGVRLFI